MSDVQIIKNASTPSCDISLNSNQFFLCAGVSDRNPGVESTRLDLENLNLRSDAREDYGNVIFAFKQHIFYLLESQVAQPDETSRARPAVASPRIRCSGGP